MAIDPYSLCPGGTGKKVKFCCSDLLGELDKISVMLEGNQRQACLDYVTRLDQKHPGRACLVTTKASLERDAGRAAEAEQTLQELLVQQPDNPFALAEAAVTALNKDELRTGIDLLQRAIAASPRPLPEPVLLALADLIEDLLAEGHWLAARQHLYLYLSSNRQDESAWKMLMQIGVSAAPLPHKESVKLSTAPPDAPWKPAFDEALAQAQRGNLRAAEIKFSALAERTADSPALWRNLAILRVALVEDDRGAEAWSKLAALDIPGDDAVEAEALAQFFAPAADADLADLVQVGRPILDMEQLAGRVSTDKRLVQLNVPRRADEEGQPPPKATYLLLDRPLPAPGTVVSWDATPRSIGNASLYGRETDREARLELIAWREEMLAQASALLTELAGDLLGPQGEEVVVDRDLRLKQAFTNRLVLPADTSPDDSYDLHLVDQRHALHERLGGVPLALLDGKGPQAVAADPAYRLRLAGLLLRLQLTAGFDLPDGDFDELRRRWELPIPGPIEPGATPIEELPLMRLARLPAEQLSDEQLYQAYVRALSNRVRPALARLAPEVLARAGLAEKISRADTYAMLAESTADSRRALEFLGQAREAAVAAGKSSASWDLSEVRLRLARGEGEQAVALLQHVQDEHWNEPGVQQAVGNLLVQMGILHPDGSPVAPLAAEASPVGAAAGAAAEPGKLWTPEGAQGGEKPKLWLPGSK